MRSIHAACLTSTLALSLAAIAPMAAIAQTVQAEAAAAVNAAPEYGLPQHAAMA